MTIDTVSLRKLASEATPGPYRECGSDRGGCVCGLVWSESAQIAIFLLSKIQTLNQLVQSNLKRMLDTLLLCLLM